MNACWFDECSRKASRRVKLLCLFDRSSGLDENKFYILINTRYKNQTTFGVCDYHIKTYYPGNDKFWRYVFVDVKDFGEVKDICI